MFCDFLPGAKTKPFFKKENLCQMKNQTCGYGPHLMLDLNECDPVILNDLDACFKLLNELPEMIRMTKITQPYVFRYSAPVPEDSGITGVTIIAESHIPLHTYPKKRFVFVDLFSCKPFDVDIARKYIIQFFQSKSPVVNVQERGVAFPATLQLAS
jgi:S-adenosylmethionine decarboxylase